MPAHALLPAVNRLLQQVEETSGLPVAVAQQSDLSTLATVLPATPERQAHLIAYRDADEASSYHVAFEAALLLRLGGLVPEAPLLAIALSYRLVTSLADLLGAATAELDQRLARAS